MGVQMFVCLSACYMWRANGNPNPYTDLDEIFHAHPYLSKEGFGPDLTPNPLPPLGLGGSKHYKLKDTFLRCSAGSKLTWAAPGTLASFQNKSNLMRLTE